MLRALCRFRWLWNWRKRFCMESFGLWRKSICICGNIVLAGMWSKSCRRMSLMTGVLKNFAGCMQSMLRKYINSLMVYILRDTSIDSVLELPFAELSLESLWYDRFDLAGANGLIIWFSRDPFEVRTCVCKISTRENDLICLVVTMWSLIFQLDE